MWNDQRVPLAAWGLSEGVPNPGLGRGGPPRLTLA